VVVDPDFEMIEEVVLSPANSADHEAVEDLLAPCTASGQRPTVVGDCAYAGGDLRERLRGQGYEVMARVPFPVNRAGRYSKDDFGVDLQAGTVTCPAGANVAVRFADDGSGRADFAGHCASCAQRERCTTSATGRSISIHRHEALLQEAKAAQADPEWRAAYRSTRPKVERKIAHLMRRSHGGRRARSRGAARAVTDFVTRAAVVNMARLATLGVNYGAAGWQGPGP
jgi:hypothetical protein